MTKILITGGSGELGSILSNVCINKLGWNVKIIDKTREQEAWRLKVLGVADKVEYVWKDVYDLRKSDLQDVDIIFDCACQPDRDFGITSPYATLYNNLMVPFKILDAINIDQNITIIYPSSCVEFLGLPINKQPILESSRPVPTNIYGWSKWSAEELYLTYNRICPNLNVYIIRTGSVFYPMMRITQFIPKTIYNMLKNKPEIHVKSPLAKRTFTYGADVENFYIKFFKKLNNGEKIPTILNNGGNKENKAYTTIEIAEMIARLTNYKGNLITDEYELGEKINNQPVVQIESNELAKKTLNWSPQYTVEDGLISLIVWFKKNLWRYV